MKLKNENIKSLFFYSKLGREIGKQNLLLYHWTLRKKFFRSLSVSSAIEKINFLYNIRKLKFDMRREDDNEKNIFSIEEKEKQRLEDLDDNIEERKDYKRYKDEERNKNIKQKN